jgi:hypothetical protein
MALESAKWEGLAMINNNPFAYKGDTPYAVTDVQVTTNSKVVTVSVNTLVTALPAAGAAIFVQDTDFPGANGVFSQQRTGWTKYIQIHSIIPMDCW